MKNINKLFKEQREYLSTERDENGTWDKVRSVNNFTKATLHLPWGIRNVLVPNSNENNHKLQRSRGLPLDQNDTDEEMMKKVKEGIEVLKEADTVRIQELETVLRKNNLYDNIKSFCEIGFRIPRLQNFYKNLGMCEKGYDINRFSVKLGRELGFNCDHFNLLESSCEELDLEDVDLTVCYHVLEHIPNPLEGLRKIHDRMKKGSVFQVEIPVEPDGPRLRYGHLYPFFPKDMEKMISTLDFNIIYFSSKTHTGGPWIERYTVLKN